MDAGPWNWLEVAKLATGVLSPIAIAALGIYIHRVTKRFEHLQWRSQKLVEKRLAIYDELAPKFNDLLCYFTYVGNWRDKSPLEVVALKREIDRTLYLAAPLFSTGFFEACIELVNLCYETYTGWGNDAKLRTAFGRRKEALGEWDLRWEASFSTEITDVDSIRRTYLEVMRVFAEDIGVVELAHTPPTGRQPTNVR